MEAFAAFLRGINVGGNNKVPIAALREALTEAGFEDVRTFLQSGNVVLRGSGDVEATMAKAFGLHIEVVTRTRTKLGEIIEGNPFPLEAKADPSHLLVHMTKHAMTADQVEALRQAITGPEKALFAAGEAYLYYPDGIGVSTLKPKTVEACLGKGGTARNWNTLLKVWEAMQ